MFSLTNYVLSCIISKRDSLLRIVKILGIAKKYVAQIAPDKFSQARRRSEGVAAELRQATTTTPVGIWASEMCKEFLGDSIAPTYLEGGITMANEIKVGKNESIDSALRRFKRMSQKAGTLAEVRKREHYEKPSVRRKKKSEAARKRKFKA